jgi:hypothetical protein
VSRLVRRRLEELTRQGEARRRRTSEIRQEANLLLEKARQRRWAHTRDTAGISPQQSAPVFSCETDEKEDPVLSQVRALLGGDVLDQTRALLQEVDTREREHWNDDDTRILACLEEAWAAAARRGYTLEDLQAVLRLLAPPR